MDYAANVFVSRMLHGVMRGKLLAHIGVEAAFVGVERAFAADIGHDDFADVFNVGAFHMEGTDMTATLHKGDNGALAGRAGPAAFGELAATGVNGGLILGLAEIGFVGFDNLAGTAKRASRLNVLSHSFADAVAHEPRGFVGHANHAVDLMGGNAFLAGSHQFDGEQPLIERDFGAFKDGANRDGELLAAFGALVQAGAVRLASKGFDLLRVCIAAMRANGAIGPALRLKMNAGGVGIGIDRVIESGH